LIAPPEKREVIRIVLKRQIQIARALVGVSPELLGFTTGRALNIPRDIIQRLAGVPE